MNTINCIPTVILDIVLSYCNPAQEEHQRNQDKINKLFDILHKNTQYKRMCFGWRFLQDEVNKYPYASKI